jgi:transcriptional regulator with XRE-family HTH domain
MSSEATVDVEIGRRLKALRAVSGVSVKGMAEMLDSSIDDICRIEDGSQRVKSSQLWAISASFNVPVDYFVEGLEGDEALTRELNNGNIVLV